MRNKTSKAGLRQGRSRAILFALLGLMVGPFPLLSQYGQGGPPAPGRDVSSNQPNLSVGGQGGSLYFGKDELTYVTASGTTNRVEKEVALGDGIQVLTNGTFRVGQGKERTFKRGELLMPDGMLLKPDGSLGSVVDHVVMVKNQVMVFRDGESSILASTMKLGDGTTITPDGFNAKPGGVRLRLLDGLMFRLDGRQILAKDSIMLREGKVWVQKDGSSFQVPRDSSLIMNEGTKVFGDGTVVRADGTPGQLKEGDLVLVEGAVRKY
jgi:hypothetical protein